MAEKGATSMGIGIKSVLEANARLALAVVQASGPPYVVHGAVTSCSYGLRQSHVVVPLSHGCFIHNIAQLTISDYKPNINIQNFGGCTSPENPSVKAAAKTITEEVNAKPKGFFEKVVSFFVRKPKKEADVSFTSQCAGTCTPIILAPWDNEKDIIELDGSKPLLKTGTLNCIYAGKIKLETTGQPD